MQHVTLCVGQCGVQIGAKLNERLESPCIWVDTEPKVVRAVKHVPGSSSVIEQSGRGNNWALGYNGPHQAEGKEGSMSVLTLETMRQHTERCDIFRGTVILHSIGGGTGSGLTCRIAEGIRDEYPNRFLMSCAVAPSEVGETPLQYYNSALSLACLQDVMDAIVLFQNREMSNLFFPPLPSNSVSAGHLKTTSAQREQAFAELPSAPAANSYGPVNEYIGNCLVDLLAPSQALPRTLQRTPSGVKPFDLGSFISQMTPLASNKFIETWSSAGLPSVKPLEPSWSDQSMNLLRKMPRGKAGLATQVSVRGDNQSTFMDYFNKVGAAKFHKMLPIVGYMDPYYHMLVSKYDSFAHATVVKMDAKSIMSSQKKEKAANRKKSKKIDKSVAVTVNRGRVRSYLKSLLIKSVSQYQAKAYLHWYSRAHCSTERFEHTFETLKNVIDDYSFMTSRQ